MGYIGATPSNAFINNDVQRVTNSTNNYVDLDHNISSLDSVIVFVNNVRQESTNLTFTSASRITLGDTLTTSDVVEIVFIGKAVATQSAAANSITNSMLAGSIANSKLANSSITLNGSSVSLGGSATVGGDNTPYFSGKKASDQTITRNTMTTVTGFTTTEIDSDSAFDGTTFTVPSGEAGVYFFSALVTSSFNTVGSDGERCLVTFMKNGSDSNMPNSDFTKASGYNIIKYTNTITAVLNLAVGDAITVAVYNKDGDASGNAYVNTNSNFMGYKLIT